VQEYNFEQQQCLKEGLLEVHPTCAFASILTTNPPTQYLATPFGSVPKGCILSYQSIEYDKPQASESPSQSFPSLPLAIIRNAPCVFSKRSDEEHIQLSNMNLTMDEAHVLEQTTRQQSKSAKWRKSRVGRVTASRFGDVLLRKSPPSESFVDSFFDTSKYSTIPAPINHGLQNEIKAQNAYSSITGFVVHTCGLVVNPSFPWLGASPDGLVKDPLLECFGLLEIKCPFTHRFCSVEEACSDPNFFACITNETVTLKQEHKHYYQIQSQMALCQVSWCDFVIYTHKNFSIERIQFNEELWDDIQPKLTDFFFTYILPQKCIHDKDN